MEHISLHPLLIIALLALIVPILFKRMPFGAVPTVVGEIICGMIVGKSGLNLIQSNEWLDFLSLLGFTYLIFLAGAEIDFSLFAGKRQIIKTSGPKGRLRASIDHFPILWLAILIQAATFALAFLGALLLNRAGYIQNPFFIALLLSTTSLGVVMQVLKEAGESSTRFGQAVLLIAAVADFATMTLITIAIILSTKGPSPEIAYVAVLIVAFFAVYKMGAYLTGLPLVRRLYQELAHAASQLRVRTAFALMLFFIVLAQQIGTEMILGAFLAGAIYSLLFRNESRDVEFKLDAIGYGFFIPVFFIMVGVNFDLKAILSGGKIALLGALIVMAYLVKGLPALLMAVKFSWKEAAKAGVLLSSHLSLIIAAAETGHRVGAIDIGMKSTIILLAVITCILSPTLFSRFHERRNAEPIRILILGAGKMGRLLAQRLHERDHDVALLDHDSRALEKSWVLGMPAYRFDGNNWDDAETLLRAGIEKTLVFVAVTDNDATNYDSCIAARSIYGVRECVARVNSPSNSNNFIQSGIRVMNTVLSSVIALENLIYRPNAYDLLSHAYAEMEVVEVNVTADRVHGKALKDLSLPGAPLILLLRRDAVVLAPRGDTIVKKGDVLTICLPIGTLEETTRLFNPERPSQTILTDHDGL